MSAHYTWTIRQFIMKNSKYDEPQLGQQLLPDGKISRQKMFAQCARLCLRREQNVRLPTCIFLVLSKLLQNERLKRPVSKFCPVLRSCSGYCCIGSHSFSCGHITSVVFTDDIIFNKSPLHFYTQLIRIVVLTAIL